MSGDCPHRTQLESILLEYQRQTTLLVASQSDYLRIIGDLKNELDALSCQATSILDNSSGEENKDTDTPTIAETDLIRAIHELEQQNDLLQAALVRATKNGDDHWLELEEKNAYLQSHVESMLSALVEKDKLIAQQNVAIARLSSPAICVDSETLKNVRSQLQDSCKRIESLENELDRTRNAEQAQMRESRKLNDELIETKRKNGQLLTQVERLRLLLNDGAENYKTLQKNYESLNKNSTEQSKQIQALEQRIVDLQKTLTQDSMETRLLQHQLTTLRQKEAITNEELKAMQNRYTKMEGELSYSRDIVAKLKSSLHEKEDQYCKSIRRQQETNSELGRSLRRAVEQLEKLRKEYEELNAISIQQTETIESYNKWKIEQRKADVMTRESIEKYENYIKLLTEQNKSCLKRCRSLHENNHILTEEIKRLRVSTLSTKSGIFTPVNMGPDNLLVDRLDRLRQATQRVFQQKIQLASCPKREIQKSGNDIQADSCLNTNFLPNFKQQNSSPKQNKQTDKSSTRSGETIQPSQ